MKLFINYNILNHDSKNCFIVLKKLISSRESNNSKIFYLYFYFLISYFFYIIMPAAKIGIILRESKANILSNNRNYYSTFI